jgi:hypothetical protein
LRIIDIPTARVFKPLHQPSRYKGAWGGRGGGKSHFFGELLRKQERRRVLDDAEKEFSDKMRKRG